MALRELLVATILVTAGVAPVAATAQHSNDCAFPLTETDATGTEVTVSAEPERVVTLNPSAAQTMWEIGAKERVVGVTKHATNLADAEERANISADGQTIHTERVVGLEPDLVLAPNVVDNETVGKLRDAGLTVYKFREAESVADIQRKTRTTGALVGECDGAEATVERMTDEIDAVEAQVDEENRPDVLYVFFGFTAGENTFIHRVIETAGGNNVAADAGIDGYQKVNTELVVERDPDWIVLNSESDTVPDGEAYEETTAVTEEQVVVVNVNHLNRPGPRVVRAISELADAFHPDTDDATGTNGDAATETDETGDGDDATATDETSDGATATATGEAGVGADANAPGLGAAAATVALAATALLAARRSA